jgi:4-carboxymuconolactone decarboxylase
MARIQGVEPAQAGWFTRVIYWFVRRKVAQLTGEGRLVEPVKITAHHPRLLRALGHMEAGQEAARSVPAALKALASLKAAVLIGCPF